jgi:hypothetical protein
MEETDAEYACCLHKTIYMGHRRYLDENHRWRYARRAFNGHQEFRPAPKQATSADIKRKAEEREAFLQNVGIRPKNENLPGDPVKEHEVKRHSKLFDLLYWRYAPN